jgi:hypothetical protein
MDRRLSKTRVGEVNQYQCVMSEECRHRKRWRLKAVAYILYAIQEMYLPLVPAMMGADANVTLAIVDGDWSFVLVMLGGFVGLAVSGGFVYCSVGIAHKSSCSTAKPPRRGISDALRWFRVGAIVRVVSSIVYITSFIAIVARTNDKADYDAWSPLVSVSAMVLPLILMFGSILVARRLILSTPRTSPRTPDDRVWPISI